MEFGWYKIIKINKTNNKSNPDREKTNYLIHYSFHMFSVGYFKFYSFH